MTKFLFGLLTLSSISAYADCTFIRNDLGTPDKGDRIVKEIMKKKGYIEVYSRVDAAYEIDYDTNWRNGVRMQGGRGFSNAEVTLRKVADGKIVYSEAANGSYGFLGTGLAPNAKTWSMLKRLLTDIPTCK